MTTTTPLAEEAHPGRPDTRITPQAWVRANLFNSVMNFFITLIVIAGGAIVAVLAIKWLIEADYAIVRANLRLFMVGQFPKDELWRPWTSGLVLLAGGGFAAGAMAHTAYEDAEAKGLPAERASYADLLRRFWPILAVSLLFVSFARTALPYIGVAVGLATVVALREIGWRMPRSLRTQAVYLLAVATIVSMLILAGTSRLGGGAMALVVAAWTASLLSRREFAPGRSGLAQKLAIVAVAALAAFLVVSLIPFDGYGWENWGGLHITLFTTVVGIALGMPFGILLALGRQSELPVLKTASVLFIEFVRGVPLISLLLFSNLMLPLFLPPSWDRPADLTLAIIVITGFSAAYIAEIVRGGLQAVPKGQTEAGQAAGMSAGAIQVFIVLPQALRAVIPAMVGQFIALFKDTSLLSIIGIPEFLQIGAIANAQNEFVGRGLAEVTYLIIALGYWAYAYTMSKESRRLETKLGVGVR